MRGILAARFLAKYSEAPGVDCWVDTNDVQRTLEGCLRQYELQGGRVSWSKFVRAAKGAPRMGFGASLMDEMASRSKAGNKAAGRAPESAE